MQKGYDYSLIDILLFSLQHSKKRTIKLKIHLIRRILRSEAKASAANVDLLALAGLEPRLPEPIALQRQIHQALWYLLIGALEIPHEMTRELLVPLRHQRVGRALFPGSARPTDSVRVSVDVASHVVIYDRPDVRYVQTSSCGQ